jgi:hypothetical protein
VNLILLVLGVEVVSGALVVRELVEQLSMRRISGRYPSFGLGDGRIESIS